MSTIINKKTGVVELSFDTNKLIEEQDGYKMDDYIINPSVMHIF